MSIRISVRAIICDNDEIFLCSNVANKPSCWCLPGGRLEENETLPSGLKRELFEEFGVHVEVGNLLYIRELLDKNNNCVEFFFMINNPKIFRTVDMEKASTAYEIEKFSFFKINKLSHINVKPEILSELMHELKNNNYIQPIQYIGNVK